MKIAKTGLTEDCNVVGRVVPNAPEGQWEIAIDGGSAGSVTLPAGGGKFLTLVFETLKEGTTTVGGSLGTTSPTNVDGEDSGSVVGRVVLNEPQGATVTIVAADPAKPTEVPPYSLGDITGDGKIDEADVRELAKLKNGNGRKHTANQLKAGDFNGNGKLDNADYQALRELLKEKGLL